MITKIFWWLLAWLWWIPKTIHHLPPVIFYRISHNFVYQILYTIILQASIILVFSLVPIIPYLFGLISYDTAVISIVILFSVQEAFNLIDNIILLPALGREYDLREMRLKTRLFLENRAQKFQQSQKQ